MKLAQLRREIILPCLAYIAKAVAEISAGGCDVHRVQVNLVASSNLSEIDGNRLSFPIVVVVVVVALHSRERSFAGTSKRVWTFDLLSYSACLFARPSKPARETETRRVARKLRPRHERQPKKNFPGFFVPFGNLANFSPILDQSSSSFSFSSIGSRSRCRSN